MFGVRRRSKHPPVEVVAGKDGCPSQRGEDNSYLLDCGTTSTHRVCELPDVSEVRASAQRLPPLALVEDARLSVRSFGTAVAACERGTCTGHERGGSRPEYARLHLGFRNMMSGRVSNASQCRKEPVYVLATASFERAFFAA
jgi:hypothetical protein